MQTPPPGVAFVVWMIVLVASGTVLMALYKIAVWWGERVNTYEDAPPVVMSRSNVSASQNDSASLRTDEATDGRTEQPTKPSGEQLLTLYRLMREHGIKRDEAAAALRVAGLPLSNDVWRRAEPPAPPHVTPIAGRRTEAQFESDADYPYEALA